MGLRVVCLVFSACWFCYLVLSLVVFRFLVVWIFAVCYRFVMVVLMVPVVVCFSVFRCLRRTCGFCVAFLWLVLVG